jgi:hypothetical protein
VGRLGAAAWGANRPPDCRSWPLSGQTEAPTGYGAECLQKSLRNPPVGVWASRYLGGKRSLKRILGHRWAAQGLSGLCPTRQQWPTRVWAVGGPRPARPRHDGTDAVTPHQPLDATTARPAALSLQLDMDTRAAIAPAGVAVDPPDVVDEVTIGSRSWARGLSWCRRGR